MDSCCRQLTTVAIDLLFLSLKERPAIDTVTTLLHVFNLLKACCPLLFVA